MQIETILVFQLNSHEKKKKKRERAAPCLSLCYTLTWSSTAEFRQCKHTLKSQIIDRIITLALQGQCKCWNVAFGWIWYWSCSPQECNRKWNARGKESPYFSPNRWFKKIIRAQRKASKSNSTWNLPKYLLFGNLFPNDTQQCFVPSLLCYWFH